MTSWPEVSATFAAHGKQDGDADDVLFGVSVDDLTDLLPTFDQRRRILATDALASVEGFRIMVQLTMQYLFGVNFCPCCPNCHIDIYVNMTFERNFNYLFSNV